MPSGVKQNMLAGETSPYLKSASHQPVHWYPWSEEAFKVARKEKKPILLDIGAVWCHWCHVMDTESYENEHTARIINEHYVAIKVDRDERPDVDSRYQAAVSAISGQGGWPLTAFLTPSGLVYFGGTYFPPEDRYGRIGFPKALMLLAEAYRNEPDKVLQNAEQVKTSIQDRWAEARQANGLSDSMVNEALDSILKQFDEKNGGFGSAPKFPHCSTIELLLSAYDRLKEPSLLHAVTVTLRSMANGGVYDQLGGGFHRYSTDETWLVPHFEKMLYDNAPLLINYVHTYQETGDTFYRDVAVDIIRFVRNVLSDEERGGFFGSQDADVVPGDDGSYFTWTFEETKRVLTADEFKTVRLRFGISERGQMHNDPSQNVLHVEHNLEDVAASLGKSMDETIAISNSARAKLIAARSARKPPFVDQTIYADWNGMMISAFLEAFKVFQNDELLQFSLKTLDRILTEHLKNDGTISHRAMSIAPEGFLDDQIEIVNALLQAFEVTSDQHYLDKAESLIQQTLSQFWDNDQGAFFDTPSREQSLGLLGIRAKPVQDSPVAGPNSVAIAMLNKLGALTNKSDYATFAEVSLKYFSGVVGTYGIFASRLFLALEEFLHPPPRVVVISDSKEKSGKELLEAALRTYRPGKVVTACEPWATASIPVHLRSVVKSYVRPVAYVCSHTACAPPVYEVEELVSTILSFGRN